MVSTEGPPRLSRALLDALRTPRGQAIDVPNASLLELPETVVQFGTGGFLRGFVGDFLHRANVQGKFNGRVVVVGSTGSARNGSIRDQDGLYTLVVQGRRIDEEPMQECRIITSVSRALSAVDEWDAVLALAREPQLQLVFSNTTEVGITLHPTDGAADAPPSSFPAKLTRFLWERAKTFDFDVARGLVIIPCELIEDNGTKLEEIVHALARRWKLDARFATWLDDAVPFCNTLVDRIVPGTPRGDNARALMRMLGYEDALLTCCEPYCLFAIEGDDAMRARLGWTSVDPGIVVSEHIGPYRERKVRLLNGAHTLLVPVALPMGCELVRDAITHPAIGRFVRQAMLEEIAPTLDADGAAEFAEAVLERFQNPFIMHALIDITLQATMKMRVRVVPTIQRFVSRTGQVPQSLAFGFAAFLLFMQGQCQATRREHGLTVPADDHAAHLKTLWERIPADADAPVGEFVWSVCRDSALWGTDLTLVAGFCEAVADHLWRARSLGVGAALDHHLSTTVA